MFCSGGLPRWCFNQEKYIMIREFLCKITITFGLWWKHDSSISTTTPGPPNWGLLCWMSRVEQTSQPLVDIYACSQRCLAMFTCFADRLLIHPEKYQHQPLLQGEMWLRKEASISDGLPWFALRTFPADSIRCISSCSFSRDNASRASSH